MSKEENRMFTKLSSTKESSLYKGEINEYSSMDSYNDSNYKSPEKKRLQNNSRSFNKRIHQKLSFTRNLSQIKEENSDKKLFQYSISIKTPKKKNFSSRVLTTTQKLINVDSIKLINENLRKSGKLLGNNREKPKHISSQEYSTELSRVKKRIYRDKNFYNIKKIFSRSDIDIAYSFLDRRRENYYIERKKHPESRLEKIKKKLKFPIIDNRKDEFNSYVDFKGRRMKKSKTQKYQSKIELIVSLNSFLNTENINSIENTHSNTSKVKFKTNYNTRNIENYNSSYVKKSQTKNYKSPNVRFDEKTNFNNIHRVKTAKFKMRKGFHINEKTWLKEVSEIISRNLNADELSEIIKNHSSRKGSSLNVQNFANSRQNTENIIEEESRFTLLSERKEEKKKLLFKDDMILNEKSTNTTPKIINKKDINKFTNVIHISPDNTILTPIRANSPGNFHNSSDLNYLSLSNDKSGIIGNKRKKKTF